MENRGNKMKLLWIQIQDHDSYGLMEEIQNKGYRATLISSTEDFLNYGETTLLLGVEDEVTDNVIRTMKTYYQSSMQPRGEQQEKLFIYVLDSLKYSALVSV